MLAQAEADRERLLAAIAVLARERCWSTLSVGRICEQAGVPRRAFNLSFGSVEACWVDAVERALQRLWSAVEAAQGEADADWAAQVTQAIVGFLGFVRHEPEAAWMSVVAPLGGSDAARAARQRTMDRFVALFAAGPDRPDDRPRPTAGIVDGAVGGLWEMARQYLSDRDGPIKVEEIAGSSTFLALTPFLRREHAMRYAFAATERLRDPEQDERSRAEEPVAHTVESMSEPSIEPSPAVSAAPVVEPAVVDDAAPLPRVAVDALAFIAAHPHAEHHEISAATGHDQGDAIRRQLRRLEDLGLVTFERRGRSKHWTLSAEGERLTSRLLAV